MTTFQEVKERRQLAPRVRALSPEEEDLQEAQRIMHEAGARRREQQEELEKTIVSCTSCEKPAKYTRQAGWMQGTHYIFTCSDGHESAYKLIGGVFIPKK